MMMFHLAGLRVRSEFKLPGWPLEGSGFDVSIIDCGSLDCPVGLPASDLILDADLGGGWRNTAWRHAGGYLIQHSNRLQVRVSEDLTCLEVFRLDGTTVDFASLMLGASTISMLNMLRGHLVLHAAVVKHKNRAIAICGPSGAGKSTCAARLLNAGAHPVSDDLLVVSKNPPPTAAYCTPQIRLRSDMVAAACADSVDAVHQSVDGRTVLMNSSEDQPDLPAGVPLATICVPERRQSDVLGVALERMSPMRAMQVLGADCRRVLGVTDQSLLARDFSLLANLVGLVPVYRWLLPKASTPTLAQEMLASLDSIGGASS